MLGKVVALPYSQIYFSLFLFIATLRIHSLLASWIHCLSLVFVFIVVFTLSPPAQTCSLCLTTLWGVRGDDQLDTVSPVCIVP